jgi:hypothetical protein
MATPYYLEAPKGEEAPKPSFLDRVGTGLGNLWTNAPPEAFFSLAEAMARPGGPFASKLAMGLSGFGRQMGESQKQKGLASAFDSMAQTIPEQMRPIFEAARNDPEMQRSLVSTMAGNMFAQPKKTDDLQEYEFARGQGFNGTFADWQQTLRRAGANNTTVNVGGERAFDKGVGEFQAKSFGDMATGGMEAKGDLSSIGELEARLQQVPGGVVGGLQALGNSIGVPIGKGASDAQAASAIIARLVPTQRAPGSGQMSDRDLELFKDSLPKLINTPEGNKMVISTMKAMAQFKMDQARIAAAAMNGQLSRQQAQEALINLPDPMAQFRARQSGGQVTPGGRKVLKWNPTTGTAE